MEKQKRTIITRPVVILGLISLLTDVASEMLYPVMPVYLKTIGFSMVMIGILEGFVEALAGISKGFFGQWSDRLRRRVPFISAGYALSAISKPMLALSSFVGVVFTARTFDRLGKGIRTSARDAYLSEQTTPENKGKVFGFHRSMDTLGAAIGPAIALVLMAIWPGQFRLIFLVAFVPGLAATLLTLVLRERRKRRPVGSRTTGFFSYLSYWKSSPVPYRILVSGLLIFTLFNSSDAFLLLVLDEKGFQHTTVIGYYILYNIAFAIFSYPLGMLADRVGLRRMLLFGLAMFAVTYFSLGFVSSVVLVGLVFVGYGLYSAATDGVSKALITNMVNKEVGATALGFYNSLASLATMLASFSAGLIWSLWGSGVMLAVSATGALLAMIFLMTARWTPVKGPSESVH